MNYIVNPSVFYWFGVAKALKVVSLVFFILSVVSSVFLVVVSTDKPCWNEEECATFNKWRKIVPIALAISTAALVLIPSKETLIEMMVARFATVDNANWTLDAVKSAVDYIVEAMKAIK